MLSIIKSRIHYLKIKNIFRKQASQLINFSSVLFFLIVSIATSGKTTMMNNTNTIPRISTTTNVMTSTTKPTTNKRKDNDVLLLFNYSVYTRLLNIKAMRKQALYIDF